MVQDRVQLQAVKITVMNLCFPYKATLSFPRTLLQLYFATEYVSNIYSIPIFTYRMTVQAAELKVVLNTNVSFSQCTS